MKASTLYLAWSLETASARAGRGSFPMLSNDPISSPSGTFARSHT